jgi:hypothetical protein
MVRSLIAALLFGTANGLTPLRINSATACPKYEYSVSQPTASCQTVNSFQAVPLGSSLYFSTASLPADAGITINPTTGEISGQPTDSAYANGVLTFFVYAWDRMPPTNPFDIDGRSPGTTVAWEFAKNSPPEVVGTPELICPDFTWTANNPLATCNTAQKFQDPDGDTLTYALKGSGLPAGSGLRLDRADGRIYGTPTEVDYSYTKIPLMISASDPSNLESPILAIEWTLLYPTPAPTTAPTQSPTKSPTGKPTEAPTQAPAFSLVPNQPAAMCGGQYRFDVDQYYTNNAQVPDDYQMRGQPFGSGLTINPDTGVISGLLTMQDALNSPLLLKITNNGASIDMYQRVNAVEPVQSKGYIPNQEIVEGLSYEIDLNQYFSEQDDVKNVYTVMNSPSKNFVVTDSGMLVTQPSMTDVAMSPFNIEVQASNSGICGGGMSIQTISVTVVDSNLPPVYNGPLFDEDGPYCLYERYQKSIGRYVSDPEDEAVTFSVSGLPAQSGLSWDEPSEGIIGIPNPYDVENGPYTVIITMTDASGRSNDLTLMMDFAEGKVPPIVDPPIPSPVTAFVRERFMGYFNFHFREMHHEPLIYSVHGLPPGSGLGIGPITGIFSGSPNEADLRNSPIPISIFASNEYSSPSESAVCVGHGGRARADFLLVVENRLSPPLCMPIPEDNCYANFNEYYQRDVMRYFKDPNMKGLTFSLRGLPRGSGLSVSERGMISGILSVADLRAQPMQLIVVAHNDLDECETVMMLYVSGTAPTPAPMLCAEVRPIPPQLAVSSENFYMRSHVFFPPPPPPRPSPESLLTTRRRVQVHLDWDHDPQRVIGP